MLDPFTSEPTELFHPRRHNWVDHFAWNDDFTLIYGITSIGRATVVELDLNRAGIVNLRRLLIKFNQHPPA